MPEKCRMNVYSYELNVNSKCKSFARGKEKKGGKMFKWLLWRSPIKMVNLPSPPLRILTTSTFFKTGDRSVTSQNVMGEKEFCHVQAISQDQQSGLTCCA